MKADDITRSDPSRRWRGAAAAASTTGISVMDGIGYRDISDRSSGWFLLS